jgi:hypothetical protein
MKQGDRVRKSGQALESLRMYWLSQGEHARKVRAKEAYDNAVAERGTITAVIEPTGELNRATCQTYEVKWDNGSVSKCMPYMVIEA